MRKSDAEDGQNGKQPSLAGYQQMRRGDIAKLALNHEDEASCSSLDGLMSAESQPELMPFMQEITKFHSVKHIPPTL